MTKKKSEQPAAGIGNNSAGVTSEVFNKHLAIIEASEAACKAAGVANTKNRKAARAAGIILGIFDEERRLVALPRAEQIERLEASQYYKKYLRSPIGAQITMNFDSVDPLNETDDAARARIEADAESDGYRAGLAGVKWETNNPHSADTPEGQAWIKGYRDGQTNRAEALGDEANTGA